MKPVRGTILCWDSSSTSRHFKKLGSRSVGRIAQLFISLYCASVEWESQLPSASVDSYSIHCHLLAFAYRAA